MRVLTFPNIVRTHWVLNWDSLILDWDLDKSQDSLKSLQSAFYTNRIKQQTQNNLAYTVKL